MIYSENASEALRTNAFALKTIKPPHGMLCICGRRPHPSPPAPSRNSKEIQGNELSLWGDPQPEQKNCKFKQKVNTNSRQKSRWLILEFQEALVTFCYHFATQDSFWQHFATYLFFHFFSSENVIIHFVMVFHVFLKNAFVFQ